MLGGQAPKMSEGEAAARYESGELLGWCVARAFYPVIKARTSLSLSPNSTLKARQNVSRLLEYLHVHT